MPEMLVKLEKAHTSQAGRYAGGGAAGPISDTLCC